MALLLASPRLRAVVISEINYHPKTGDEALEFVEIQNDLSTPEDISGYAFTNGIEYVFEPGTVLGPYGVLVVCADVSAVKARYGITNAVGNFTGKLDSSGERLTLSSHAGVIVSSLRYSDEGKWPGGPDGTGHTLVLRGVHLDPSEPESWAQSPELGGSPGRTNFTNGVPQFVERVILARGETWRYAKGTQDFSTPSAAWRSPSFNDSGWLQGPAGFGYGDNDDATVLDDMANTYVSVAIRTKFSLTAQDIAEEGDLFLAIDYDDGFIAYLNGSETARASCGNPGQDLAYTDIATAAHEIGVEEAFVIPKNLLVAGQNTLAIEGHNFSAGSSDFSLNPRVVHRRTIDPGSPAAALPVTFNELRRGAAAGQGWLEIYNAGAGSVDLTGFKLTDDPSRASPYILGPGAVVQGHGFAVVQESAAGLDFSATEVRLFLLDSAGNCITASAFDRAAPPGAAAGSWSECRYPDGGPLEFVTTTPTSGAANQVALVTDVVINEIFYHPPDERHGEFIELYNRGAAGIDISGFHFTKGIDYTFPDGTLLPADGYVVVAEDPALILANYGVQAHGPYVGQLSNAGENVKLVDRAGNVVDEVRYFEGGEWPRWADGGGSSLELIDPRADNSFGLAWDASDETAKAEWTQLTFPVTSFQRNTDSELHMLLAEAGVVHVDDVSIMAQAGGANLIPNPGFEAGTAPWVIQGTHVYSRRVTTDQHSGAACLEVIATSKGDNLVNRIEVETSPAMAVGGKYDVSLWTRWQRGGSLLVLHSEWTAGSYGGRPGPAINLSGNTLSAGLRLSIPLNLGTPGAENSARLRLKQTSPSGNLGPVIAGVTNRPVSPTAAEAARVTARIADPDGIASATIQYRTGSAQGAFSSAPLFDDGSHGDGAAGDGVFAGDIPPQAGSALVVFYVEAADSRGASRRYPVDAPTHTCLYQVQGRAAADFDAGRVLLDAASQSDLSSRPLHSNDLADAAFVFNDEEIYYNVGVRYRGSPWGRNGGNIRVKFQADRPFPRAYGAINLDNSGGAPNEGTAYLMVARSGTVDKPAPASYYGYIRGFVNGGGLGLRGLMQPVSRDMLTRWYGDVGDPMSYKVEGRRQFNDAQDLAGQWDGGSFIYRGETPTSKENYRGYFIPALRQGVDDWTSFIAMTRVMDRNRTPNASFDTLVDSAIDVEEFLRGLTPRILMADWDAFCVGNGHNGYLTLDPNDGLWEYMPHDMDFSFADANATLFPTSDPDIVRLMGRPGPKRTYYRILWEYTNGYWSSPVAGPALNALQAATGLGFSGLLGYIDQSGQKAKTAVQSSVNLAFKIITNNGADITTNQTSISLQGDAPVTVASIFFTRNGGDAELLSPVWSTPTRWQATFALPEAENQLELLGFDGDGSLLASAKIKVTSSALPSGPIVTSYFPNEGPIAGGTLVTFTGGGYVQGMKVLFGGVEATEVQVLTTDTVLVTTPPGPSPPPADGKVDIELVSQTGGRTRLAKGFTYVLDGRFVRGDVTNDGDLTIADAVASLFHLYRGTSVLCEDAVDANDDGAANVGDVIYVLNYLFRGGAAPPKPFPTAGTDSTSDRLDCHQ